MGCEQIETEMAQLEQFEGVSRNAEMASTATKVGQAATTQAAVMGLGGSVPYIGGIGNIFGSVMGARADNAQKEAEQAQDRMNRLMGIYSVKSTTIETPLLPPNVSFAARASAPR